MKRISTLFAILLSLSLNAQVLEYYYDGSESNVYYLYEYPNDPTRIVQASWAQGGAYSLQEVTNGNYNPITIPLCTEVTTPPLAIGDGLIMAGNTVDFGNEIFFLNGTNSFMYDLNPGASGSNVSNISNVEGETFIIGSSGAMPQAFRFVDQSTIEQITNETELVTSVCAVWEDTIYYSVWGYDQQTMSDIFRLKKAMWNGSSYDYAVVREVSVQPNVQVYWKSPIIKWGRLFLDETESDWSMSQGSTSRVISVNPASQVDVLTSLTLPGFFQREMFEWDGKVYTYVVGEGELLSSQIGTSFSTEFSIPGIETFGYRHIAGNKLYMTLSNGDGTFQCANYDGSINSLFTAEYMLFREEHNDLLYLTEQRSDGDTYIHYVNTQTDDFNSIFVGEGYVQSVDESTLIFDDKFTFLFENQGADITSDVLQFGSFVGESELSNDANSVYPNPAMSGGELTVFTNEPGEYTVYGTNGALIQSGKLESGKSSIQLNELDNGVYFIEFMGVRQKLVVN